MEGAAVNEGTTITIGLVVLVASVAASAVYVTLYIHRGIQAAKDAALAEVKKVEDRHVALVAAFAAYREHALEHFMSKGGGREAIDRVGDAVLDMRRDIGDRMKDVGERVKRIEDRLIKEHS